MDQAPRADRQHRPVEVLRLRRQPLGPSDAGRGRQPGRRLAGCVAVPGRARRTLADRRLEDPVHQLPPAAPWGECSMMLALEMYRSPAKFLAAKAVGGRIPGILTGPAAPLRLVTINEPKAEREGWARIRPILSGICGSDLGMVTGSTKLYFSAVV